MEFAVYSDGQYFSWKNEKKHRGTRGQIQIGSISTTSYKILTANVAAVYQVIELIKNNDGIPQRMMCELVMDRYI